MKLFDLDSKFMHFMNKFADLMWLNILTLIFCIPLVTVGASVTAMHRVLLAIYRDEESYITRSFWKSFKQNFKQSTIIWLIYLAVIILLISDFLLIYKGGMEVHAFIKYALIFVAVLTAFSFFWVFVLQSRYENKVWQTIKNSLVVGTSHFFYSIMMMILSIIPLVVVYLFNIGIPLVIAFGFTAPGILMTMLYSRVFDRMEGVNRKELKKQDDGWTVELEEEMPTESDENAAESTLTTAETEQNDEQN